MAERFYLVKSTCKATEHNRNFCRETETYIHGKGEYLLYADTKDKYIACDLIIPCFVREYGYSRVCDAKRSYIYKHPDNTEYWRSTVEIVAVEVYDGYCKFA